MSMETYHSISDETMNTLLESFEALVDEANDRQYEVEYSVCGRVLNTVIWSSKVIRGIQSGVLTLTLGVNGTYVINKQPPNKQIWLSSPIRRDRIFFLLVLTFLFECRSLVVQSGTITPRRNTRGSTLGMDRH